MQNLVSIFCAVVLLNPVPSCEAKPSLRAARGLICASAPVLIRHCDHALVLPLLPHPRSLIPTLLEAFQPFLVTHFVLGLLPKDFPPPRHPV